MIQYAEITIREVEIMNVFKVIAEKFIIEDDKLYVIYGEKRIELKDINSRKLPIAIDSDFD